jgi:hypothetical protein
MLSDAQCKHGISVSQEKHDDDDDDEEKWVEL